MYVLLPLLSAVLLLACTPKANLDQAPAYRQVRMAQGGCFGTCPVFSLAVRPDGQATYTGRQYSDYQGEHTAALDAKTLATLNEQAAAVYAQRADLPARIESGIADLSEQTITIVGAGDSVTYTGDVEWADPVGALRKTLLAVADDTAWAPAPGAKPGPANEIAVTVAGEGDIEDVVERYFRQQLSVVRELSRNPLTYLVRFDAYATSQEEMIRELGRDEQVVEVKAPDQPATNK